jgi:hypothetical protein
MDVPPNVDLHTKAGGAGGILAVFLFNISSEKLVETMVLAGIGAVVSFSISHLLQRMVKKRQRKL